MLLVISFSSTVSFKALLRPDRLFSHQSPDGDPLLQAAWLGRKDMSLLFTSVMICGREGRDCSLNHMPPGAGKLKKDEWYYKTDI
jgi:hypothetical protein